MILAVTLLALGLVLMIEGLVYALAPRLVEQMLDALRQMPLEARRLMGVLAMVAGLVLVWLAKALGA